MKKLLIILIVCAGFIACEKDSPMTNLNVEGYWLVLRDTNFTASPANATADLFHLFKAPNAFYRFSFAKTFDYTVLSGKPRSDSMISYFQTVGNQLQIPNPTQSSTNQISGNNLLSQTANEMQFTRTFIERRDPVTGAVLKQRTDTITYQRVTDANKIKYFDNYLKQWHP